MARRPLQIGALLAVAIAALLATVLVYGAYKRFHAAGPLAEDAIVLIEKGSSLASIARILAQHDVISDALLFRLGVRAYYNGPALKAGEYAFAPGVSMRAAMDKLVRGETLVRRVTVPEGLTSREVVELLEQAYGLEGEIGAPPLEGTLLPETYHYAYGDSRSELLRRMSTALDETLAELWRSRETALPLESPEQALVLASIVEKETGVAAERPLIAGVFVNRLRKGMPLQSDPTVAYGLTRGAEPLGRSLTRKDLAEPSPYNTYKVKGLPPGPIANPGRAALEATLQPAETDYLYFVADGSGGHAFATSLEEHNRNVAAWRRFQKQQGEGEP